MNMTPAERERIANGRKRYDLYRRFVKLGQRLVSSTAAAVWFTLWGFAKPSGMVRMSQQALADCIGVGERDIRKRLTELQTAGLLVLQRRGSPGRSSAYWLKAPAGEHRNDADTGTPGPGTPEPAFRNAGSSYHRNGSSGVTRSQSSYLQGENHMRSAGQTVEGSEVSAEDQADVEDAGRVDDGRGQAGDEPTGYTFAPDDDPQ